MANHKTCLRAAQPKNSGGDLFRSSKPPDWLISQNVLHGVRFLSQHLSDHRRLNRARTHCINADSSRCIFKRCTLSETDHSVLGCMVNCPARNADKAANRRAIDDSATSLLAHLSQFVFHAVPHTAKINSNDTLVLCT